MTVFISSRISILQDGRRLLAGVTIPDVLGGGVTPTYKVKTILNHKNHSPVLPLRKFEVAKGNCTVIA